MAPLWPCLGPSALKNSLENHEEGDLSVLQAVFGGFSLPVVDEVEGTGWSLMDSFRIIIPQSIAHQTQKGMPLGGIQG